MQNTKYFCNKRKKVKLDVIIKNVYFPSLVVSYFKRANDSKWSAREGILQEHQSETKLLQLQQS